MRDQDIFRAVVPLIKAFEQLGIAYYIGGSVASSAYGKARATMDVDCVSDLTSAHIKNLVEILKNEFYADEDMIREAVDNRSSFNLIHLETMLKVDVFVVKSRSYDREALQRRKKDTLDEGEGAPEVYLASPEDVVLSKLDWFDQGGRGSEKQWNDVLGVLMVQKGRLDLEYLEHWAGQLSVLDLLHTALSQSGTSDKKK